MPKFHVAASVLYKGTVALPLQWFLFGLLILIS